MNQQDLSEHELDIIIIGAGASGLSLLLELHHINDTHRIKVLEQANGLNCDRIWSLWQPFTHHHADSLPQYLNALVAKNWRSLSLSVNGNEHLMHNERYRYTSIRSSAFGEFALACAKDNPLHEIHFNSEVLAVTDRGDCIEVRTQNQQFFAKKVIDTRPPSIHTKHDGLVQCFYGQEIAVDIDIFDDAMVQLMGALKCGELGLEFVYILPFSPRHALIEFTCFSPSVVSITILKKRLKAVIQEMMSSNNFHVLREESAALPMYHVNQNVSNSNPNIVYAGISGGAMRASTGYSFLNCYRWAQKYARELKDKKTPVTNEPINCLYKKMDAVMLKVLRDDISVGVTIFSQMFKKVKPDSFARFMSERATLFDIFSVISAMPKQVFVRSALVVLLEHLKLSKKHSGMTK